MKWSRRRARSRALHQRRSSRRGCPCGTLAGSRPAPPRRGARSCPRPMWAEPEQAVALHARTWRGDRVWPRVGGRKWPERFAAARPPSARPGQGSNGRPQVARNRDRAGSEGEAGRSASGRGRGRADRPVAAAPPSHRARSDAHGHPACGTSSRDPRAACPRGDRAVAA